MLQPSDIVPVVMADMVCLVFPIDPGTSPRGGTGTEVTPLSSGTSGSLQTLLNGIGSKMMGRLTVGRGGFSVTNEDI